MANNVLSVEEFTEAANILFRIGDYHQPRPMATPSRDTGRSPMG